MPPFLHTNSLSEKDTVFPHQIRAVFASSSMERPQDTHPSSMGNPHPLYYVSPVADRFPEIWTLWWASTRHTKKKVSMDAGRTVSMAVYELPNKGSDKATLSHSTGEGSIQDVCSLILTSILFVCLSVHTKFENDS